MASRKTYYDSMSWMEFESHVIEILGKIYRSYGFQVHKTPFQNDHGRDGYGSLQIGPMEPLLGQDLSIVVQLWAEVKKRSSSKVDLDDIGGHLILALNKNINKILFITNNTFSNRAKKICTEVGLKANLGVAFIDGAALHELDTKSLFLSDSIATRTVEPVPKSNLAPRKKEDLHIFCGFSTTLIPIESDFNHDITIGAGEIVYWICKANGNALATKIDAKPPTCNSSLKYAYLTPSHLTIDGIETYQQITIAIWSDQPALFSTSIFEITVQVDLVQCNSYAIYGKGMVIVKSPILIPSLLKSQSDLIKNSCMEFEKIKDIGGTTCILIESNAGMGKSFLVQRLRQEFFGNGIREIFIDGASTDVLFSVVQSILQQIFPLPQEVLTTLDKGIIELWLSKANQLDQFSPTVSEMTHILLKGNLPGKNQDVCEFVASSLINASSINPVVLIFEDLHKTGVAIVEFFQKILGILASRSRGKVIMILTTRPKINSNFEKTSYFNLLDIDSSKIKINHHCLNAISEDEACELLQKSIRNLTAAEAKNVIAVVGTNPFLLREALQFLRVNDIVALSPDGYYFIFDQKGIKQVSSSNELLTVTTARIKRLTQKIGPLLEQFLLLGACLGKIFSSEDVIRHIDGGGIVACKNIISICFDSDILKPLRNFHIDETLDISFDHDLVRNSILIIAGERKIQLAARSLLRNCKPILDRRIAILNYFAGTAPACLELTNKLLFRESQQNNHREAIQYAFLQMSILIFSDGNHEKFKFLVPYLLEIDEALVFVSPPKLHELPSALMMIKGFRELLFEMECVGMLESEVSARIITLAAVYAGYASNNEALAEFYYYEGRHLFGLNMYKEAYDAFLKAETFWPRGLESRAPQIGKIRIRQAICERHLGDLDAARNTMNRALKLRNGSDWLLFQAVVANLGAFYMYSDQRQAYKYWEKGLRVARRTGDIGKVAHFLNDLGHLEIMERNYKKGLELICQADDISTKYGLKKEQLRSDILKSCIFLCLGNLPLVQYTLSHAENIATSNGDLRRLWRIKSNMATWAELCASPQDSIIFDLQALAHMPIHTEFDENGTIGGRANRVVGALINIMQRYILMPERYNVAREKIGEKVWRFVEILYNELEKTKEAPTSFAGGLNCLYHYLPAAKINRFLITE